MKRFLEERPRVAGFFIGVIAGAAYLGARFGSLRGIGELVDHDPGLFQDFSMYFYRTGLSLNEGSGPVGGFLYPPLFGILMMPMALLRVSDARMVWGILQAIAILGLVAFSARLSPPRVLWAAFASAATLTSTPVLHSFKWGQIGVMLTLMALIATECAARRKALSIGLLSFAATIKIYPAVVLSVFARRRDWKSVVAGVFSIGALLYLVPLAILGERRTVKFFEKVAPYLQATQGTTDPNSQSVAAWLSRMFGIRSDAAIAGLALVSALWIAWILFKGEFADARRADFFAAFLSLAWIPFVVPTCWANYFAFLPPFAAFLASEADAIDSARSRRAVQFIAATVLFASTFVAVDLTRDWERYVTLGVLLIADLTAMTAALLVLRRNHSPGSERREPAVAARLPLAA